MGFITKGCIHVCRYIHPMSKRELSDYVDLGERAIRFTCKDCGEQIERAPAPVDIPGLTPARCASCTLDRMAEQ